MYNRLPMRISFKSFLYDNLKKSSNVSFFYTAVNSFIHDLILHDTASTLFYDMITMRLVKKISNFANFPTFIS